MKIMISLVLSLMTSSAWAGGVKWGGVSGGGGGGTTNPAPVSAGYIAQMIPKYGVILRVWLQTREVSYFRNYGQAEPKEEAILKAIFESDQSIYEALKEITVTLKMSDSCYDLNGKPSDGSYDPNSPLSICISLFSLANKLKIYDVDLESTGLLAHEFAHAVGASEEQATGLQRLLLRDLLKRDLPDISVQAELVGLIVKEDLFPNGFESLQEMMDLGLGITLENVRDYADGELSTIVQMTSRPMGPYEDEYVNNSWKTLAMTQNSRVDAISDFVCVTDPAVSKSEQAECKSRADKIFGSELEISAREYEIRAGNDDPGIAFDRVRLKRPVDAASLRSEWLEMKKCFEGVKQALMDLSEVQIKTVKK